MVIVRCCTHHRRAVEDLFAWTVAEVEDEGC
eukprot:COSAG02_NODE_12546_length_1527_cov_1.727591_3_plen_30_part_01